MLSVLLAACGGSGPEVAGEVTPSAAASVAVPGLTVHVLRAGDGATATAGQIAVVHYTGWLHDPAAADNRGTKFDSSVDRGQPATFALNAVIPGWTEALQLMPVGSKYTLWIPSELAYGDRGTPGPIGPNATLKFEVELLEIVKQ
jgi:FKBP-type peptidyl-prolyl cis-trans isomerase